MGDPLNPIVPILPTIPTSPDTTRIRPIEREQQRESAPDWQSPEEESKDETEGQFEDDYDPDWGKWVTVEPVSDGEPAPEPDRGWDPALGEDRRSEQRPADDDHDDDEPPRPHIDITA